MASVADIEPIAFAMEREMLRGIKERAERSPSWEADSRARATAQHQTSA